MGAVYDKLTNCLNCVRQKTDFVPKVALVLGSGLGDFARNIEDPVVISYCEIEGFPTSTVVGHAGNYIFGHIKGVPVVCMQGRVHYYEGYPIADVVLPVRLMGLLGAKTLFLTNASGGIREGSNVGDFMIIKDHISLFAPNPLIGPNEEMLGCRFPDMSSIYKKELSDIIKGAAADLSIPVTEGVYVQLTGPSYESPAEIRLLKTLGADAVGMSTVCEAIAANHMGMNVCGISFISNLASGISKTPLSHAEVKEAADQAAPLFEKLVSEAIARMGGLND